MQTLSDVGAAIAPAEIVDVNQDAATVWVRRQGAECTVPILAKLAISWSDSICPGATALLANGEAGECFVIGLLESPSTDRQNRVETTDGVCAQTTSSCGSESLSVFSAKGELLFEYDVTRKRTRIYLGAGDVQFVAADGGIDFVASGGIRLHSQQGVDINGRVSVQLQAGTHDTARPTVSLSSHDARITGPRVEITTPQLDVAAVESRFTGRTFMGRLVRARIVTKTLEMILGTLVQKAGNVFRRVAGLDELHAGNSRLLVDDSVHVKGEQVNVKADGDVRINGEQIHLG